MVYSSKKKRIRFFLDILLALLGIASLVSLIALVGFYLSPPEVRLFSAVVDVVIYLFIAQEAARWGLTTRFAEYLRERWLENLLALLLMFNLFLPESFFGFLSWFAPNLSIEKLTLLYLGVIQFAIIFVITIKVLRYNHLISRIQLHPGAIFALSFAFIILSGSALLMLPKASPMDNQIKFVDALFTSTSAVCVTGLVAVDTATAFTSLGKFIIMFLIQVGGLGVMTLTTFFAVFLAGGMSYHVRLLMQDLLSHESIEEVSGILVKIALFTFVIEFAGAISLYLSLGGQFSNFSPVDFYSAIFHSVAAFCNAGFSLYSKNIMDPMVQNNYLFTSTIMMLIILGGLGFTVLSNLARVRLLKKGAHRLRKQLQVPTKLVLITTVILIFGGALLIWMTEPYTHSASMIGFDRFYHALFQSVSARTAGFNTIAIEKMAAAPVIVLIVLMWIGASPGSTGGGIKTTTFAIAFLAIINLIRGKERFEIFHRMLDQENVRKAFMVIFASLGAILIVTFILVCIEPDKDPLNLIFEATSAFGTVGLSRDVTMHLGTGAKAVLIGLMYVGRIGILTFLLAFYKPQSEPKYALPKVSILVG